MSPVARLALGIAALGVLLVVVHLGLAATWRFKDSGKGALRDLFLVNREESLMSWLSVTSMYALAVACLASWERERRRGWLVVGLFFAYLSMDDACAVHERVGWIIEAQIGEGRSYRWIEFMGPVIGVGGLLSFGFIWKALPAFRRLSLLAFGLLGSAMGLELIERPLAEGPWRWRGFPLHVYTIPFEEFFELLGPVLLFYVVGRALENSLRLKSET